jgi:hypothetical protein
VRSALSVAVDEFVRPTLARVLRLTASALRRLAIAIEGREQ